MPLLARTWRFVVAKTELNQRGKITFFRVPTAPRQPPSSNNSPATIPDRAHASGLPCTVQLASRRFEQLPPNALSCPHRTGTLRFKRPKNRYSQHRFGRFLGECFPAPSAGAHQKLGAHTLHKECANGRGVSCLCWPGHGGLLSQKLN